MPTVTNPTLQLQRPERLCGRKGRHHRLRRRVYEETLLLNVSRSRPTLTICPRPQP
jgi:hypothetical protein